MTQFQREFGIIVAISALLVGLACSLGGYAINFTDPTETPTAAAPFPTAAQMATAVSAPTGAGSPTKAGSASLPTTASTAASTALAKPTQAALATQAPQPGALPDLSNLQTSFNKLDSYKMNFVMEVTGKDSNGKDVKESLNLIQEIIRSKDSMHMSMSGNGLSTGLAGGSIDIYQIGKAGYMLMGDPGKTSCLTYSSDSPELDASQLLTPDEMINSIKLQSLIAKGEMVNGVKADHYKVENSNLGFGTTTTQSGEVWLAQDGGYMVKFTGTAQGDFTILTDSTKGTVTWTYNLTDANKLKEIVLPAECAASQAAISDLPIPPNATDQGNLGDLITFSSPDAPKTVGDYFRANLPGKGWKIVSDTSMDTVVMMTIQKDTRKYSVMIAPGNGNKGSSVVITKAQ